jgi:hypothetical protein
MTSPRFDTQSLPSLFRCYPYSFTFYLGKPFSSIHVFLSDMHQTLFLFVFCGLVTSSESAPEPQLFAENVISTADDESHPAFTPDGKTLYFLKNDPSFNHWREEHGQI